MDAVVSVIVVAMLVASVVLVTTVPVGACLEDGLGYVRDCNGHGGDGHGLWP